MPYLNVDTKTVHEVDYGDIEELFTEVYGQDYELPCNEELGNDVSKSLSRMKKEPLDKYDQARLDKYIESGNVSFMLRTLLQDCINKDYAPEGDYVIRISW